MLDPIRLNAAMRHPHFYSAPHCFAELDSTNTALKRLALAGAAEGTVVLAERQTAGKGRMGRSFVSPPGGLYLSVLLRPAVSVRESVMMTACAGVCVAQAVEEICAVQAQIKWVNDVLLEGKKFCGILTEAVSAGEANVLVLGIGLNVNTDMRAFPPEVAAVSASVAQAAGGPVVSEDIAAALLDRLYEFYVGFPQNTAKYVRLYRDRLSILGQDVVILGDETKTVYIAVDIDEQFGLVVRGPAGEMQTLRSGEVSIRAAANQVSG